MYVNLRGVCSFEATILNADNRTLLKCELSSYSEVAETSSLSKKNSTGYRSQYNTTISSETTH